MNQTNNTLQINSLPNAPRQVLSAIQQASTASGVDFSYLINQARAESSFDPTAKAKTSSATGLYQFIDSTWLNMVERYGDDYELNTDGKSKQQILDMRKDPKAASFMAAAFASENEKALNANWGGNVGATELYLAHFMGAGGASSFLNARDENPLRSAADLFPKAARANRNVFYDQKTGKARTLSQVYDFFDKKFQDKAITPDTAVAENTVSAPTKPETQKTAQKSHNQLYDIIPIQQSNSIIMQRSQAMRDMAQNGNSIFTNTQAQSQNTPFFSLLSKPVDLMLLTQTTAPNKVIRDIG